MTHRYREVGIHDEDQPFWDAVFPASETREATLGCPIAAVAVENIETFWKIYGLSMGYIWIVYG